MDTVLGQAEAEEHVKGVCFKTGPPQRIGVELEWLVCDRSDVRAAVPPRRLQEALDPLQRAGGLPRGSLITGEPGGQVELSTPPGSTLVDCVAIATADLAALRQSLDSAGLALVGLGFDPHRDPVRVLDHPRYRAMEAHFDPGGPWGRMMMRSTASVQVSLDCGVEEDGVHGYRRRWDLVHRLGPVLIAAFANSPLRLGRPTGWRSTRQAVWSRIDPSRTRPPSLEPDPRAAWARYALDAKVMCIRRDEPSGWDAPPGLTFRSWLDGAHSERPATLDDLDYHLSTLFPPVRPRGWLELRMIDAQQDDDWIVPTAVAATLLDDPAAAEAAYDATKPLVGDDGVVSATWWERAARSGPSDPKLGAVVAACFAAVESALSDSAAPKDLRDSVADFAARYAYRHRCPADDQLDRFEEEEDAR
jgi:ergothioneine biosynthesis glutamate--cysteine ligase EgtA